MDWFTGPSLAVGIAAVVTIGMLIALGVRYLEARSRGDEEAARLQLALSEPLARAPELAGSAVRPVVSLSVNGRPRVELTGWVPSVDVREAAVRAVEHEAERLGRPVRIVDRLDVVAGGGPVRRPA
ncbi:MAG TPA: hypothetical protein VFV05_18110 [Methylomirabilota bacterium]|nr:hypothetical protein [Methylomirabilota bacterium]